MKTDSLFKKSFNGLLDHMADLGKNATLASESRLADNLGVSRTTVRKALAELEKRRIIARRPNQVQVRRKPLRRDYFPDEDTISTSDRVEQKFLEWILRGDRKPNQHINGLELAREFTAFYEKCRVIGSKPEEVESFRIALSSAARGVIALALGLLGVSAPATM